MSSGEVSGRTRMTGPSAAIRAALSAVVATLPTATPGQAPSPRARTSASSTVAMRGVRTCWRCCGRDPEQRLAAPDHALVGEVGRDADSGIADESARSHLQEPQLAGLEGELQVARVAVVLLDPVQGVQEAGPHGRLPVGQLVQGPGQRSAGDDVFALATEQDLTERDGLTGVGVAAERDSGAAVVIAVPEHHRLDGHGRAEVVRNVMELAVGRARGVSHDENTAATASSTAGFVVWNARRLVVGRDSSSNRTARRASRRHLCPAPLRRLPGSRPVVIAEADKNRSRESSANRGRRSRRPSRLWPRR